MKKVLMLGFALLIAVMFTVSCTVNPFELPDESVHDFAKNIQYTKDERTGICFAMVASRQTAFIRPDGIAITAVPCEACEHLIAK